MSTYHKRMLLTIAVAGLTVSTTPLAARQTDPELAAGIDRLFAHFEAGHSPGAAVLVINGGRIVHRKGYGLANLEYDLPITPSTVFDIASVSKQFAGWAIATLLEQGSIRLEEDVRTYLPEIPDFGPTVTVNHLVHHTSGIRDWPGTLAVAGWRMDDVISFEQILTMVEHQEDLNFVPGAEYSYSNTGYNILARLVERISGVSFREWTQRNIFGPLGMTSTHFQDDHTELVADRALGYTPTGSGFHNIHNGLTALGSSSLFTTVDDLAKWAIALNAPTAGQAAVVARMQQRGILNDGDTIAYAFGQSIGEWNGLTTWQHNGSWAGFRTVVLRIPERGFATIILSNAGNYDPSAPANRIADIVLADDVQETADEPPPPTVAVDGALLDAYVGTYRLGPAWLLRVTRHGDGLDVQATDERVFPARARSSREFFVPSYGASITFERAGSGPATHISYRNIRAPRVEPHTHTLAELEAYVGRYYSSELETAYDVQIVDGHLAAVHRRLGTIGLSSLLRDEFHGAQWFLQAVEFDRNAAGQVIGLRISNGRSRNLAFVRQEHPSPR